jgi:ring-1,2-phenylacetyl-CoA epoxidase subunit PaaB
VVKSEHIHSSRPEDAESLFDPSDDKIYRHPTFYTVPEGAKYI